MVAISTVPNQPHLYKQRVRRSNHRDVGRKPSAVPYSYTWMVVIQKTEMLLSGYSHYRFALVFNSLVFRPSPTDTDDSDEAEAGTSDIHIPFTRFYYGNRSLVIWICNEVIKFIRYQASFSLSVTGCLCKRLQRAISHRARYAIKWYCKVTFRCK